MKMYDKGALGDTLFDDWLAGSDDMMPPTLSIRSSSYRKWLATLFRSSFSGDVKILSIGSGIGITELALQQQGFDITASDCHPRSIEICRGVGLKTIKLDFWAASAKALGNYNVIYGDGILGHLWCDETDSKNIWQRFTELAPEATFLMSNDVSEDDSIKRKVTGMPEEQFFRPPKGWFAENAKENGLRVCFSREINYKRHGKNRIREVIIISR